MFIFAVLFQAFLCYFIQNAKRYEKRKLIIIQQKSETTERTFYLCKRFMKFLNTI